MTVRISSQYEGDFESATVDGKRAAVESTEALPRRKLTAKSTIEPRKRVISSRWQHAKSGFLLHSPAVIVSVTLICLNNVGAFWFEMQPSVRIAGAVELSTINVLHLLQLAAKAYEMLLVLSLSSIVLGVYRRMLVTTGLPLGLITAGYRAGSFMYLRTSALATGILAHGRFLLFGLLVVFTTVLLVLAGPASAILMVPTPGWWSLGSGYSSVMPPLTYTRSRDFLWPQVVNTTGMLKRMKAMCSQRDAASDFSCPGNGYSEIREWMTEWNGDALKGPRAVITMKSATVTTEIYREVAAVLPSDDSATFTTTLSSVTALTVRSYFDYITQMNDVGRVSHAANVRLRTTEAADPNYQPLAQTKCKTFDLGGIRESRRMNNTRNFPFWPMENIECFDDGRCAAWQARSPQERLVPGNLWNDNPQGPNISFRWVETEGALSAVFTLPYLLYPDWRNLSSIRELDQAAAQQGYSVVACSLVSRWVPSSLTAELSQSRLMQSNISDPARFRLANSTMDRGAIGSPVRLTKEWADLLDFDVAGLYTDADSMLSTHEPGAMANLLNAVVFCGTKTNRQLCSFGLDLNARDGVSVPRVAEKLLGIALADGLSRVGLTTTRGASHGQPQVVEELSLDRIRWRYLVSVWWYPGSGLVRNCTFTPNTGGNASLPTKYACVTNGTTYSNEYGDTMAEAVAEFRRYHRFGVEVDRYGYGSGAASPTLTFSLAVVYLYLAAVLVYIAASVGSSWAFRGVGGRSAQDRVGRVNGWDDIQDLVALAWQSRPPQELENVGAGVKPFSQVWREVAIVRVNERDCLELVLQDDNADGRPGRLPEKNKFYG